MRVGVGEELEGLGVVVGEVEVDAVGLIGFFKVFGGIFGGVQGDGVVGLVAALQGCPLKLWRGGLHRELYAVALVVVSVNCCDDGDDDDCAE